MVNPEFGGRAAGNTNGALAVRCPLGLSSCYSFCWCRARVVEVVRHRVGNLAHDEGHGRC